MVASLQDANIVLSLTFLSPLTSLFMLLFLAPLWPVRLEVRSALEQSNIWTPLIKLLTK